MIPSSARIAAGLEANDSDTPMAISARAAPSRPRSTVQNHLATALWSEREKAGV